MAKFSFLENKTDDSVVDNRKDYQKVLDGDLVIEEAIKEGEREVAQYYQEREDAANSRKAQLTKLGAIHPNADLDGAPSRDIRKMPKPQRREDPESLGLGIDKTFVAKSLKDVITEEQAKTSPEHYSTTVDPELVKLRQEVKVEPPTMTDEELIEYAKKFTEHPELFE